MKKILIRISIGFMVGIVVFPALIACIGLYMPLVFGVDPIFGSVDVYDVIKAGYVITEADVADLKSLQSSLVQVANIGLVMGALGAFIGGYSWYSDMKNGHVKI